MPKAKTPADLTITPRDRRFGRDRKATRWWMNGDPYATAFFNALSVTFPKGEAFFIDSVKAFRDGVPPRLAQEIRAFTQQEVMHSREHIVFNKAVVDAGYDVSRLDARVDEVLALVATRPKIASLAATMALEHYTAIIASLILEYRPLFRDTDREQADLWRWHAIEEVEHKGVAYDVWNHATREWSAWRRWRVRSLVMLIVTYRFWVHRIEGTLDLLRQDGITGWKAKAGLARYLLWSPGVVRRLLPSWLAYYRPGFHPWDHDDRALIGKAESEFADAVMPTHAAV